MFSSITKALTLAPLLSLTSAAPTTSKRAGAPSDSCTKAWQPTAYPVFPSNATAWVAPDEGSNTTFYQTASVGGANPRLNVLVWRDIPGTTREGAGCDLHWSQPVNGTNFGWFGLATFNWYELDLGGKTFDEAVGTTVSWEHIEMVKGEERVAQSAHEFWPVSNDGRVHGVGGLGRACSGDVAFLLEFNGEEEGMLVMDMSEEKEAGFFLKHGVCEG